MTDQQSDSLPLPGDYRQLINQLQNVGYEVKSFVDFDVTKPHILLRHDVDLSIRHAYELAKLEVELDVKSAYFILLRSDFYNPFSAKNTRMLNEIIEMGHDIGLHIDLSVYNCLPEQIHKKVVEESRILSELLKIPIYLVSFHRPTALLRNTAYDQIKLPGFVNIYEPSLFRDIAFVSDSRGAWYHGHPLDQEKVKNRMAIQLLTHPIWWIDVPEHVRTAGDKLHSFAEYRNKKFRSLLKSEFRILK